MSNFSIPSTSGDVSRELIDFLKTLSEATTNEEVHNFLENQLKLLEDRITKNPISFDSPSQRELLVRLLYCEMLGHPVPFGYMSLLNLTQMKSQTVDNRLAYTCISLFLHPNHPITTLCTNSFLKALRSANHKEMEMALTALSFLLDGESVAVFMMGVKYLLTHHKPQVRKKAVCVVDKMLDLDITYLEDFKDSILKCFNDTDPSVMGATLNLYYKLITKDPSPFKGIVPSVVCILKQIQGHRLEREYDYHGIPAPWMQMKCLQILALLGAGDEASSKEMYEIIGTTLQQQPVNQSLIYQCILTIITIHPNPTLLNLASQHINNFLAAPSHDHKYIALKTLKEMAKKHLPLVVGYLKEVVGCVHCEDDAIRKKMVEVLLAMANSDTVSAIIDVLVANLDRNMRNEIIQSLTQIAQDTPHNQWFIQSINSALLSDTLY